MFSVVLETVCRHNNHFINLVTMTGLMINYHIAGNVGRDLNLAYWWFGKKTGKLNST